MPKLKIGVVEGLVVLSINSETVYLDEKESNFVVEKINIVKGIAKDLKYIEDKKRETINNNSFELESKIKIGA